VFMTIAAAGDTLAPADRALTIYPRHTAVEPLRGPGGLAVLAFRDGTPYAGEDLVYEPGTAGFLVRCTRGAGPCPLPASTTVASTRPTSWCASRAIGSTTGAWLPRRSTG